MFVCLAIPSSNRGFAIIKSMDIFVKDCDICFHPYWEDELIQGMCAGCYEEE